MDSKSGLGWGAGKHVCASVAASALLAPLPPWRWEQHPLQTWTSFDTVVIVGCLYNPPSGVVCGPHATQQPENWRRGKSLSPIPSVHLRASWALPLDSSPSLQQVQHYLRMVTGLPASLSPFVIAHIWGECPSSSRHCAGCKAFNRDVFPGPQSPARVESQRANRSLMKHDEDTVVGLWKKQYLMWWIS